MPMGLGNNSNPPILTGRRFTIADLPPSQAGSPISVLDQVTSTTLSNAIKLAATGAELVVELETENVTCDLRVFTPTSVSVSITQVARTSNVATYTADNSFQAGDWVLIAGLTTAGFNGLVQVLTSNGSSFTAANSGSNVSPTADTGTGDQLDLVKTFLGVSWTNRSHLYLGQYDLSPLDGKDIRIQAFNIQGGGWVTVGAHRKF